MRYRMLLLVVLLPTLPTPAQAGILFGRKKERPDPRLRVPELVTILRTDRDADKRSRAADELRQYDASQFPDIVPALIQTAQTDNKPGVRIDAIQSLSKIRPVSQPAGEALEHAVANDPSMRVRLQARSALLMYQWAGYRGGKKVDVSPLPPAPSGGAPPVVNTTAPERRPLRLFSRPGAARPTPGAPAPAAPSSTREPPLAEPLPLPRPTPPAEGPRLP